MYYIIKEYKKTLEIKQSKFIAYFIPFKNYFTILEKLQHEYPKARHFVVAYRYLNEYNQIVEHSSDDGEPKGTSGKPSLMVLQGSKIINSAVIIVRFFGGTKLGTGGLVRAYSEAVNLVINNSELIEYKENINITIEFSYEHIRKVDYECNQLNVTIVSKKYDTKTQYILQADKESISMFLSNVERLVKQL